MDEDKVYCSWCMEKHPQALVEQNYVRRNVYRCRGCGNRTLECRGWGCDNAARAGDKWDEEWCAEHDGSIASFEKLTMKLDTLEDYAGFLEPKNWNMAKVSKVTACAVGAAVLLGPLAYAAAPAIASGLGAAGVLGAAGTGTAISSLSGAALTSASLAAVGSGYGMAGGAAFITAAGAALGARQGGVVSHAYAREIQDFSFIKHHSGEGPTVVFFNGFLTQKDKTFSDWEPGLRARYPNNPWYEVTWESKTLRDVGELLTGAASKGVLQSVLVNAAKKASKAAGGAGLGLASIGLGLAANPWHVAMTKAAETGILVADLLARTRNPHGFILIGHSLGARVISYALQALATRNGEPIIEEAVLLGGAVGVDGANAGDSGWRHAARAVRGRIHNFYSSHDDVLRFAYSAGTFFQSTPIGRTPIGHPDLIEDHDVSDIIDGHNRYKQHLAALLRGLDIEERAAETVELDCPHCEAPVEIEYDPTEDATYVCPDCGEDFVYA